MTIFVWDDIICDIGANICIWSMSNICAVSSRHMYVFQMGRWGNIDHKYIIFFLFLFVFGVGGDWFSLKFKTRIAIFSCLVVKKWMVIVYWYKLSLNLYEIPNQSEWRGVKDRNQKVISCHLDLSSIESYFEMHLWFISRCLTTNNKTHKGGL